MSYVVDNLNRRRYELDVDGHTVFADYRLDGRTLYITHVEAPIALRGTGAAGRLMEGLVPLARSSGYDIVPVCSYAVAWMKRYL